MGLETPCGALLASEPQFTALQNGFVVTLALLERLFSQTVRHITKLQWLEQGLHHPGLTGGTAWGTP